MNDLLIDLLSNQQSLVAAISLGLLAIIGLLAVIIQNQRRSQTLLAALNDSSRSQVSQMGGIWRGSIATFERPPDPFRSLEVMIGGLVSRRFERNQLLLRGKLHQHPQQELLWIRGRPPGRALVRSADASLWELRRLDLVDGEFVVRGINSAALEHTFFDLQARFGAFLRQVSVQVDSEYHVEVLINASRLTAEDIPALITTIRSLGRAALR